MKLNKLHLGLSAVMTGAALTLSGCGGDNISDSDLSAAIADARTFASIEFTDTAAPSTAEKMATTYTESSAIITYTDGSTATFPLTYKKLFGTTSKVGTNANPAGQLYDQNMNPLKDDLGMPLVAETPDSNSLLKIGNKIYMVSHLEYDWIISDGSRAPSRAPMGMILTEMQQDPKTGELTAVEQAPISFSNVDGLWIPCFGSQTPWNTHLGSEEDYDMQYNPLSSSYSRTTAAVDVMSNMYFNSTKVANPYHYGYFPEVTIHEDGSTDVVKHYSMGRGTWEAGKVMPDSRTVYYGDDGTNVALFMYVADKAEDLSAGSLYAGKFTQTGAYSGNFNWIKLGHATDAEVKALADTTTFDDIFVNQAFDATTETCPTGTTRIQAGSTMNECLAVKTGMEKAAAFLESRRYAALMGATVEFNKMEGIAVNDADKKLYMAISYLDKGMKDNGLPAEMEHIKMTKINAGVTFTMPMTPGQVDDNDARIESDYVVTSLYAEDKLIGRDIATDALGNTADPDFIANTDNIFFSEKMRTLFVGEDSGTHVNNFVWAYNIDTKKLSRILTNVAGAEATGLQAVENMDGFAYIMSNSQHHGDYIGSMNPTMEAAVEATGLVDKFDGNFGYIGGMPAIK
ncbi:exported alkaline phosphatase [Thiosulfatimonas sediminis]|uniref:Exported alkaline phosphatase n=1 Tax=Thiosulfatimonas sediminis TaxID=2675054 RepID=A0A6F8PXQ1_9GAMM|nr:alkaline phosphatase PhoX [Thiosulfatimonas sediminis]BBP46923.1 exported alkaline phosphatase [Thiosulfatimonas sediminis]